jgi:large subunit ribosomal protein L18
VESVIIGDNIIASAHSSELAKEFGWLGSCKNVPASYLTGFICGKRAAAKKIKKAILDIGLHSSTPGCRIYAALKGFVDAGVEVPHKESMLPKDERIAGKHIATYYTQIDSDKDTQGVLFSNYASKGLSPKNIIEHVSSTKEKIVAKLEK